MTKRNSENVRAEDQRTASADPEEQRRMNSARGFWSGQADRRDAKPR